MNEIMKKVGEGIRHYRKQRGLSQEELAHLAQINEGYIGKLNVPRKSAQSRCWRK
ncbi:helix-turn-helix domain-containing protein [Paenibacillus sp. N3.4]|uniref:helix-turn-helix domain-containing protein n=1 Tax=Paenibacillus sp. N3.4 TaxID=2603222 RepID=UPI00164FBB52|nr:helix-turn-helix domain-containing protein [Paenibacillus sp. N3.4]